MTLLTCQDVTFSYGGPPLFADVNFSIAAGERIGLAGRNGTGKSTLLGVVRGDLVPRAGVVTRKTGVRVAELAQQLPAGVAGAARDVVATGFGAWGEKLARYHRLLHALGDAPSPAQLAEVDRAQREVVRAGGFSREPDIERALSRVDVDPDADWETLSVGRRRRVLLARALASDPDLLLLDEPTNHLDLDAIEWMEDFLVRHRGAVLFVTHDRAFLRRVATRVLLLDRGRVTSYEGGYDNYLRRREEDAEAEEVREALADRKLEKEEAWAKQGVKARRTRAQARVRALDQLRRERVERQAKIGTAKMDVAAASRSGDLVMDLVNVSFQYTDVPVIRDFSTRIQRGDKIGVIGPNGSGKTTLLRLLLGELEPTTGTIRRGVKLQVAYFDQLHAALDESKTVAENVSADEYVHIGERKRHIVGFLRDFLFRPEQVRGSVRDLSGGERNRLLLARLFTRPSNVLVLDEPTNDLDAETVEILADLLVEYQGTVLLVSHDREFLNEVATSTIVLPGDGTVAEFVGGYDAWQRHRRAAVQATLAPKRSGAAPPRSGAAPARIAAVPPATAAPTTVTPRRRTYAENLEAAALPDRIEQLEAERSRIHASMSDPAFYARDAREVSEQTQRLQAIDAELARAYARWEELDALRA